ncbi:MAG: helix-turn-helix domain-containing protein [Pyrinomonadaceae bacterium]
MKDELLVKFGNAIKEKRNQIGISQEELAHLANLDRTYIGGVERGERNISLINLIKVSHALNIPLSKILKDINE